MLRPRREQTALHKACTYGDLNIVEMLIEATAQVSGREMVQDLLKTEDIEGNTPLLLAVESGSPKITRYSPSDSCSDSNATYEMVQNRKKGP